MRRHISAHRATTKYFSNSFVFKTKIEKEGLPRDDTPALGAGGLEFKSARPDDDRTDRMPRWHGTINPAFKRGYQVRF
jgi:hypothetical protein